MTNSEQFEKLGIDIGILIRTSMKSRMTSYLDIRTQGLR